MKTARQLLSALLVTASFSGIAAEAQARNDYNDYFPKWYIGVRGNVNGMEGTDVGTTPLPDMDFDFGFGAGASVGVMMPRNFIQPLGGLRFEAEYGRYWQNINNERPALIPPAIVLSSGDREYDVTTYMLNAYYHIPLGTRLTPYIGGGFGKAEIELEQDPVALTPGDNKDTVNAWQAMAGFSYTDGPDAITEWRVGYRYLKPDKPDFDDGFGGRTIIDTTIHSVELGLNFKF